MTLISDIEDMVDRLNEIDGVTATGDPRVALQAEGVIVLVDPPERDYTQLLQTWQFSLVKNTTDLGPATTGAFSEVLALLEAEPTLPIEEARPGARRLSPDRPPVPAYLVRMTSP